MNSPDTLKTVGTATPAIFVFVPYCPSICTYCDFNVYARRAGEFDAYVDALGGEIAVVSREFARGQTATSLAFGGGTPSILSAEQIAKIVAALRAHFEWANESEWTLEANPGTVDAEKLHRLRALGFNRLSLGIQTFDDERLRQFNRQHSVADSYEAFALARQAGFANLNLDLIYGLPGQTVEGWKRTLAQALEFGSEHLSLYGLQVEERTVLKKQIELGRTASPDPDLAAEMYELAVTALGAAGYEHYEISNFAKPGYASAHNKTYWLNAPYLGFGAGAHSSWRGERYENVKHPREYIARVRQGEPVTAAREQIPPAMEMSETIFLGLRLAEGVRWARFSERFGLDAREVYKDQIQLLAGWGFLQVDEERMRLTEGGMLVSNQLLWRFLPD